MNSINTSTLTRAVSNGISLGIIEEGVGDHKGKNAVKAGAYMAGGSLLTDVLGGNNPLANPSMWGPSARPFSDAVFYTAIESLAERKERSWQDVFRNFLYGFGSSFIVGTVTYPIQRLGASAPVLVGAGPGSAIIPPSPGAPASAVNQPVSRSLATSAY